MHSWHSSIIIPTGKAPSLLFMVIKAGFKEKFVSLSKSHRDAFCASFASELSFVEAERDYDSPVFYWHFAWSRCWFRVTICPFTAGFVLAIWLQNYLLKKPSGIMIHRSSPDTLPDQDADSESQSVTRGGFTLGESGISTRFRQLVMQTDVIHLAKSRLAKNISVRSSASYRWQEVCDVCSGLMTNSIVSQRFSW